MKINNITATKYHAADGKLSIIFTGTTMEAITRMDTALVTVQTDTGELMETYAGYALQKVTYNVEKNEWETTLIPAVRDGTTETIKQLAAQVDALTKRLEELQPEPQAATETPPKVSAPESAAEQATPDPQAAEPVPETATATSQEAQ